jgi:hypothetical protein
VNTKQRAIVFVGLLTIALACIFPPWKYRYPAVSTPAEKAAGHHFIMNPPLLKSPEELFSVPAKAMREEKGEVTIHSVQIALEILCMLILTTGINLLIKDRRRGIDLSTGILLLCFGACISLGTVWAYFLS